MQHVESTINLIEGYIPNLGEMLKDHESATAYITSVIQELLKRAQSDGLLKGVQQNWAQWKGADLGFFSFFFKVSSLISKCGLLVFFEIHVEISVFDTNSVFILSPLTAKIYCWH